MPQFNLLSFKPVVPLFSMYYSFLNKKKAPQFDHKKTIGYYIYLSIYSTAILLKQRFSTDDCSENKTARNLSFSG